jgi:KaiC/GvpD/RAD55 family RecA-like ATPase
MERIPFGISRLDSMIDGGAPRGSVVLLAGDLGAGAREFLYTSATMNGLAMSDPDLFDLYYGDLQEEASLPTDVHYVTFTADREALVDEMRYVMDDELVENGVENVRFRSLSNQYFQMSHVPTDWYAKKTRRITELAEDHDDRETVLDALGDYMSDNGAGSLVLVDSVTDLVSAASEEMDWRDITLLVKGLKKASNKWGGLVLLLASSDTMTDEELGLLMEATDGTLVFEWEAGGSERDRTLFVQQFRGVLSRLEDENIIQFETEIHDGGFDISNVRKIR